MSRRAWIGLLLLAAVLRFYGLGRQSLWSDEGLSLFQSGMSLEDIWSGLKDDVHPPLYYFTLHGWVHFFSSEAGLRASSALMGLATVALAMAIFVRLTRPRAAWLASLGFVVSASHVALSQELRSHVMVAFLASLTVYCLLRWLEGGQPVLSPPSVPPPGGDLSPPSVPPPGGDLSPPSVPRPGGDLPPLSSPLRGETPPRWAAPGWALSTLYLVHTNFFGLLMLPVHFTMGLCAGRERRRPFLLAYLLVSLATLPFLLYIRPYLTAQAHREGWAVEQPGGLAPLRRLVQFLTLYFDYPSPTLALDTDNLLNWLIFLVVVGVVGRGLVALVRQGQLLGACWLGLWLLLPMAEVKVLSGLGVDLMVFKYFGMVQPGLCGLLGAGLDAMLGGAALSRVLGATLLSAWLALNLVACGYRQFDDRFSTPDFRRMASVLNQYAQPGRDLLVIQPGMEYLALRFYLRGDLRDILVVDTQESWPLVERALPKFERVWLCLSPGYPQVAQVGLVQRLGQRLHQINHLFSRKAHSASDLDLYLFQR